MKVEVVNAKTKNAKNLLVLYVGTGEEKERVELYNVDSLDHYLSNGRSYIRVCCDGHFYYYPTHLTSIANFNDYQR